jgi:hypothetical protein
MTGSNTTEHNWRWYDGMRHKECRKCGKCRPADWPNDGCVTDTKPADDLEQRAKALAEQIFGDPDSTPYRHGFDGQRWLYPNAASYIKSALQSERDRALEEAAFLLERIAQGKMDIARGGLGEMFASQSATDLKLSASDIRAMKSSFPPAPTRAEHYGDLAAKCMGFGVWGPELPSEKVEIPMAAIAKIKDGQ